MRVPIPIAILLLLATPLGVWFWGIRGTDFLPPPSPQKLEITRQLAHATLPLTDGLRRPAVGKPIPIDTSPPRRIHTRPPNPAETIDRNPSLDTFTNLAPKGSRHLIELSTLIEAAGDRPRTLLVWERVIDSTKPQEVHMTAALASVKRLRPKVPLWSASHSPLPLVIRITATTSLEDKLKPILEKLPKELTDASHGVVAPSVSLSLLAPPKKTTSTRRSSRTKTPAPSVSLVLAGAGDDPLTTKTISFPVTKMDTLHAELLRNLLKLISSHLAADKTRPAIGTPLKNESPFDALSLRVTRLRWHDLARELNTPKPAPPP